MKMSQGGTLDFSIRGPSQQFISKPQILSHNFEGPQTVVISKSFNKGGSRCNHAHILGVA